MAATRTTAASATRYHGLKAADLIDFYRTMYTSRRLDDEEIRLKKLDKIFFQISGAGHEAVLTAAGKALKPAYDWFYPYYRDRALCLELGMTPKEMLLSAVASAEDPNSGGRQMPSHWGHKKLNIVSQSSPTGTQFLQAVGAAEALVKYRGLEAATPEFKGKGRGDEVGLVTAGDGTRSEGEFWEAMNSACNLKLPVLFLVEDNGYAISVPVDVQTAGGSVSKLVSNFPNLHLEECDGTDIVASFAACKRAVDYIRAGKGPAMIHGHVTRPYSHSLSDDERLYRPDTEREKDAKRDPVTRLQMFLVRENILDEAGINKLEKTVDQEVEAAAEQALKAVLPTTDSIYRHVYSVDLDPRKMASDLQSQGGDKTMADLINACLT